MEPGPLADCSQGSAASSSDCSERGCACCGTAKPTHTASASLADTGPTSLATATSDQLTLAGLPAPRSSAVASRVKTSVRLDVVPGLQASNQDYGRSSPASFASYDPATSSWRTSRASLFEDSTPFSQTWPMSGTTRNGTAYRHAPSALPIYELASGFWPTPVADDTGHRTRPFSQGGVSLSHVLGGPTNPRWIEWLMGFPVGWTCAARSATPLCPRSQNGSADTSSRETEHARR